MEDILVRLRREILANPGRPVMFVSTQDRVLLEHSMHRTMRIDTSTPPAGVVASFVRFDGVCLVEEPILPLGVFAWKE